jgi:SHS2 domain-containing protein
VTASAGFRILEHPADLGIEARGGSIGEAFEQAAAGLISILLDPAGVLSHQARTLHVTASDRERLLVRWLSEILYQVDGRSFVPASCAVTMEGETGLTARVRGEPLDLERHSTRTDVKAVTYHQLSVRETAEGVVVTVFLDI